jgi:signal transduction histidine kinase
VLTRVHNMLEVRLLHIETKNNSKALEQTVERLKEVERLKNGFLSTASHELRTPLTSIRGSLGLLASGCVGALSDEAVEVVAIAERNAVRLMALINDILDLERLETGTIELRFAQVPVESILRRAMESLPVFGHQHGITVEVPDVSATIWADADRIVQVVVNLLSNAVKFSPPGGGGDDRRLAAGALGRIPNHRPEPRRVSKPAAASKECGRRRTRNPTSSCST